MTWSTRIINIIIIIIIIISRTGNIVQSTCIIYDRISSRSHISYFNNVESVIYRD